jgi:hypothetical protein
MNTLYTVPSHFWYKNVIVDWEDPGVDKRIILKWIFRKWDVVVGLG